MTDYPSIIIFIVITGVGALFIYVLITNWAGKSKHKAQNGHIEDVMMREALNNLQYRLNQTAALTNTNTKSVEDLKQQIYAASECAVTVHELRNLLEALKRNDELKILQQQFYHFASRIDEYENRCSDIEESLENLKEISAIYSDEKVTNSKETVNTCNWDWMVENQAGLEEDNDVLIVSNACRLLQVMNKESKSYSNTFDKIAEHMGEAFYRIAHKNPGFISKSALNSLNRWAKDSGFRFEFIIPCTEDGFDPSYHFPVGKQQPTNGVSFEIEETVCWGLKRRGDRGEIITKAKVKLKSVSTEPA